MPKGAVFIIVFLIIHPTQTMIDTRTEDEKRWDSYQTDLIGALQNGSLFRVQELINNRANPNEKSSHGARAIDYAVDRRRYSDPKNLSYEATTMLIDAGCSVKSHHHNNIPVNRAIQWKHPDIVELLLQHGADPNERHLSYDDANRCNNWTKKLLRDDSPLHNALWHSHPSVEILLRYGAHPNAACAVTGRTPLHIAAYWGTPETIYLLHKYGAYPNIKDKKDKYPADYAENPENICAFLAIGGQFTKKMSTNLDCKSDGPRDLEAAMTQKTDQKLKGNILFLTGLQIITHELMEKSKQKAMLTFLCVCNYYRNNPLPSTSPFAGIGFPAPICKIILEHMKMLDWTDAPLEFVEKMKNKTAIKHIGLEHDSKEYREHIETIMIENAEQLVKTFPCCKGNYKYNWYTYYDDYYYGNDLFYPDNNEKRKKLIQSFIDETLQPLRPKNLDQPNIKKMHLDNSSKDTPSPDPQPETIVKPQPREQQHYFVIRPFLILYASIASWIKIAKKVFEIIK